MSVGQRVCAAVVGLELATMAWCVVSVVRVYQSVKGKSG